MGKPTGFLEYKRETARVLPPKVRIANFNEFRTPLSKEKQKTQGARCMACGVPFCQSGMMLNGMASGCPLTSYRKQMIWYIQETGNRHI
mgnify:CR=1 FL=1